MSVNSKTIFKCLSILGTAGVLLFGCMKAEMELPYVAPVEKEAIKVLFELGHAEAINDSARFDTKSYLTAADIETRISNVTLGIYETTGTQAYLGYITSGFGSVGVTLRSDKTYNIYALANMGDMRTSLAAAVSAGTLSSMTYTVDYSTMSTVGIPMSKAITGQSFSEGQNVTVYLERMLAKINVSLSCSWSEAVITGATVKNVNPTVSPFGTAPASSTNIPSLQDIHGTVAGTSSSLSAVFYVPENTQGTVGSVTASTEKTYSNSSLSGIRDYATYLEVNVTTTGEYNGSIVYRSYLGANQTTDFNILRNEVYNWTITYSKNNLQTYDWKRDTDNLYRYELVCIDQNTNISIYAHYSSQNYRTGLLRYRLNKYSVRTGSLVEAISVTPSVVSYYESANGSRTSNLLETYSISSGSVTVLANSGYAGPVYVQAQATYNGHTYRTAARKKVHVNGFMGWEYLQWTYNFFAKHQSLGGFPPTPVTFYQDNFSYRVKSYYNGTISYESNASCIQNGLNSTIGLPSAFSGVRSVGYREEYYYDEQTGYEYYEGLYFSLIVPKLSSLPYDASGAYGPISVNTTSTLGADFYPSGGFTASCNVYLYSGSSVSAYINPNKADVNAGGSQQFRFYYNSTDISSSATTTWSIVSSTGGMTGLNISSSGLFTAASNASSGTVIIQASSSTYNVSRTAIIKVTAIDSPEITYSPSRLVVTGDASVAVGSTTSNYTATLYYDEYHGGVLYASDLTADVSTQSTFSSSNNGIATMSGRVATGVSSGTAYISASYSGTYGSFTTATADRATLTVGSGPTVTYRMYDISFANNPITVGNSTTATARKQRFENGVATGVLSAASATWTSNNSSVASIHASTGSISGVNAGSTTFVATDTSCESGYQSITSGTFTVNAPVSASITFSPWNFYVNYDECVGSANALNATASYSNTGDPSGFSASPTGGSDFCAGNDGATVWFYWTSTNTTGSSRSVDITLTDPVTGASDYIRITQAAYDVPPLSHYEYRNKIVTISASPDHFDAAGGGFTLSASATWEYREVYTDSSTGSWTPDSGTPHISGGGGGFTSVSTTATSASCSVSPNTGGARSTSYTASYTFPDSTNGSDSCGVDQDADAVSTTQYRNKSVSISASPSTLPSSGGSFTLSASATWEYRYVYVSGTTGSWTSDSGTPHISGGGGGFTSVSTTATSVSCSASENTGAARSTSYTASYTFPDSTNGSDSCGVDQNGATVYKAVTSISSSSISVGGTTSASASLYRSTNGGSTWSYVSDITSSGFYQVSGSGGVSISGSTITGTSAGSATIRSNYSADYYDDDSVTVNEAVTVTSIYISDSAGFSFYGPTPSNHTPVCYVTLSNGQTYNSDANYGYFSWDSDDLSVGQGGEFTLDGSFGSYTIYCNFQKDGVSGDTSATYTVSDYTYTFISGSLELATQLPSYSIYRIVCTVKKEESGDYISVTLYEDSLTLNNLTLNPSYESNEGGLWSGSGNTIPKGYSIRGYVNGSYAGGATAF